MHCHLHQILSDLLRRWRRAEGRLPVHANPGGNLKEDDTLLITDEKPQALKSVTKSSLLHLRRQEHT
uniref:Uncharacterized protein n=1 Tax=Arundo donax TaxID=35708 RepID=A0A0A9ALY7_ARUDO